MVVMIATPVSLRQKQRTGRINPLTLCLPRYANSIRPSRSLHLLVDPRGNSIFSPEAWTPRSQQSRDTDQAAGIQIPQNAEPQKKNRFVGQDGKGPYGSQEG